MAIAKVKLPDNSVQDIHDSRIHDVKLFYGTCSTGAATAAKTVTCDSFTTDDLDNGTMILVKFSEANSAAVADLTMNVNNTTAIPIKKIYNYAIGNLSNAGEIRGTTNIFILSKQSTTTYWILVGVDYNTNENTIGYILRTNNATRPARYKFYRYRLLFSSPDGTEWIPANTSSSTNATAARTVVQDKIDPFGPIIYYATTTAVNANATPGVAYLRQQCGITLGYSFNRTGAALTLTTNYPVYLKCAPQTDGTAIIDSDNPYVQALPNTADGKIYIYLGQAYSETAVELVMCHPIYYYKGGSIRIWTNSSDPDILTDALTEQEIITLLDL